MTLSDKLKLESIVKLEIFTTPVPPGESLKSAFELVVIILSLNVMLSIGTEPTKELCPEDPSLADILPKVDRPVTFKFPDVDKFSFPKLIAPELSVIDPSAKVRLPSVEPDPAVSVPVVVSVSFPKLIAPELSVIDPFAKVKVPIVLPVPPDIALLLVYVPSTFNVPSTIKFSLILIIDESSELIVVPAENPTFAIVTLPVP